MTMDRRIGESLTEPTGQPRGAGRGNHVFVTGVTGFVGKVVLAELLRRADELQLDRITVLVRAKRGQQPEERFDQVVASRCFGRLSPGWRKMVQVVGGELTLPGCGMLRGDIAMVRRDVTHVIHCAASVEFDLPIEEAAAANITSSMGVLDLFRPASRLVHMAFVSTAYVTPFRQTGPNGAAPEALARLPFDPEAAYDAILHGRADAAAMMAATGHPNTYTLTKCINEALLARRRGSVPLSIVRPSIVSACLHHPVPGWIDSHAAFAGFVGLIGAGRLQVLRADPTCGLDIVPCDVVAERAIDTAFWGQPAPAGTDPVVRHAVAGPANLSPIKVCVDGIDKFFRAHPIDQEPNLRWIGGSELGYRAMALVHHEAPTRIARTLLSVTGQFRLERRLGKVAEKVAYLNEAFPYFTHNTFRFASAEPYDDEAFSPERYVELVCRGVYRHLSRRDEREMSIAGRDHSDGKLDAAWAFDAPDGNWAIRGAAYTMRKALRRMAHAVTFDRPSFERACAAAPADTLFVIVPTHRSYMDFLVCSYLFFARADLGIAIPHIAAAEDFAKIPILGWLFQQTQAFYIRRGVGREDPELNAKIQDLVARRQTLEFFIEGTRSRSRQFMKPRRGLLRAIQQTGQRCVLLPVAITYDRVPEERSFLRELQGEPKPSMQLRKLLMWTGKMLAGLVDIGRVHVVCGEAITFGPEDDTHAVAFEVMAQLQSHTATTTHHLRCFLAGNPIAGVDAEGLRRALEDRGLQVLTSKLGGEADVSAEIERTMRYHWMHAFYPEARALYPAHPAIQHHCNANSYALVAQADLVRPPASPEIAAVVEALFRPICDEYLAVARFLGDGALPLAEVTASRIVRERPRLYLPNVEAALEDICERGVLTPLPGAGYAWGPHAADLGDWGAACAWPADPPAAPIWRRGADGAQDPAAGSLHGQLPSTDASGAPGAPPADRFEWVPRSPLARGATL